MGLMCEVCSRYICDDPDCEIGCCQPTLNNGQCTDEDSITIEETKEVKEIP